MTRTILDQSAFLAEDLTTHQLGHFMINHPIFSLLRRYLFLIWIKYEQSFPQLVLLVNLSLMLHPLDILVSLFRDLWPVRTLSSHHACVITFDQAILKLKRMRCLTDNTMDLVLQIVFLLSEDADDFLSIRMRLFYFCWYLDCATEDDVCELVWLPLDQDFLALDISLLFESVQWITAQGFRAMLEQAGPLHEVNLVFVDFFEGLAQISEVITACQGY